MNGKKKQHQRAILTDGEHFLRSKKAESENHLLSVWRNGVLFLGVHSILFRFNFHFITILYLTFVFTSDFIQSFLVSSVKKNAFVKTMIPSFMKVSIE